MDDKVFNSLERMYHDLSGKIDTMNAQLQDVKESMATKQDIVRLESKMDTNHEALYDGYKQSIEGITELRIKLDKLTDRVENQEIKLEVLRTVK